MNPMTTRFWPRLRLNPFAQSDIPRTKEEWQVCADVANLVLTLEMARKFGLLDHKGRPNVDLCVKRIEEAATRAGIFPRNLGPGQTT